MHLNDFRCLEKDLYNLRIIMPHERNFVKDLSKKIGDIKKKVAHNGRWYQLTISNPL